MVFSSERAACPRTPSPHPPHTATLTSCRRMDLALRLLRGDPDSSSDPVTRISCSTPDSPGHKRAGPRGEGLPASDWVGVPEARLRTCEHDFSRPGGPRSDETWGLHLLSCSSRLRKGRLSDGSAAPTDTRPAGHGRIAPFSLVVKCLYDRVCNQVHETIRSGKKENQGMMCIFRLTPGYHLYFRWSILVIMSPHDIHRPSRVITLRRRRQQQQLPRERPHGVSEPLCRSLLYVEVPSGRDLVRPEPRPRRGL